MENIFPPEIPETESQRKNRIRRENYKNDVNGERTAKVKKEKEKYHKGEKQYNPQKEKEYRKKRNANAEKKARLREQKNASAKRIREGQPLRIKKRGQALLNEEEYQPQQYTEEELMQDFADAFVEPEIPENETALQKRSRLAREKYKNNEEYRKATQKKARERYQKKGQTGQALVNEEEPEPEPEPQQYQPNELQDLDQTMEELIGSGPIFSRPRRRTPEAVPVPTAVAEAVSPQLLQWGQGVLNGILNHLTEEERTSPQLRALVLHHLRDNYPNIEESPHLIQLIMNLLNEMVVGNGRPKLQAYKVQSVVFDKSKFSPQLAMLWIHQNGYKVKKVDETAKKYRFRQVAPATLRKKNYSKFITKKLGNSGIELIIAYPISYA
jgi:hypothetical protein